MRGFPSDVPGSRCSSTCDEEHEILEDKSPLPWVRSSKLFLLFVSFVVRKLALTMKRLKEIATLPWTQRITTSHFFNELAHGIARPFHD